MPVKQSELQARRPLRIWISSSGKDRDAAKKLTAHLTNAGFFVQTADDVLLPGDPITETIAESISNADVVLIFISKHSGRNMWIDSETAFALTKQSVSNTPIVIPVKIDFDAPLPPLLVDRVYIDISDSNHYLEAVSRLIDALNRASKPKPPEQVRISEDFLRAQRIVLEAEINSSRQFSNKFRQQLIFSMAAVSVIILMAWILNVIYSSNFFSSPDAGVIVKSIMSVMSMLVSALVGYFFGAVRLRKPNNNIVEKHRRDGQNEQ